MIGLVGSDFNRSDDNIGFFLLERVVLVGIVFRVLVNCFY